MGKFQPKITKARFVYGPFSAAVMLGLGDGLAADIGDRIRGGRNVFDQAAAPLKGVRYPRSKQRRGIDPVRNWTWSGRTLRALRATAANENRAVVSFSDPVAAARAKWNNARERAFGVSPRDAEAVQHAVRMAARDQVGVRRVA